MSLRLIVRPEAEADIQGLLIRGRDDFWLSEVDVAEEAAFACVGN